MASGGTIGVRRSEKLMIGGTKLVSVLLCEDGAVCRCEVSRGGLALTFGTIIVECIGGIS